MSYWSQAITSKRETLFTYGPTSSLEKAIDQVQHWKNTEDSDNVVVFGYVTNDNGDIIWYTVYSKPTYFVHKN